MTYTTTFEVTEKEIEDALKPPDSFAYFGKNDGMFECWSLGPCIATRDSGNLQEINLEVLLGRLKGYEDDWKIVRASHWACGWAEHLSFRARELPGDTTEIADRIAELDQEFVRQAERINDGDGPDNPEWRDRENRLQAEMKNLLRQKAKLEYQPTMVCRIIFEWVKECHEHVCLDESELSDRELQATIENLQQIARDVRDDAPEGWEYELHRWIAHNHPSQLDSTDFDGAWPDSGVVQEGLKALNLLEET